MTDKEHDFSLPFGTANIRALPIAGLAFYLFFGPFKLIWGSASITEAWSSHKATLALALVLGLVVHELLHVVGWKIAGRVEPISVSFGIKWRTLTPYARATGAMSAASYRVGIVLPAVILGIIPGIISLVTGSAWLLILGALMNASAGLDYLVLWMVRPLSNSTLVFDSPDQIGCTLAVHKEVV